MALDQKRARAFGVLYLITFVTSIPALALYQPVLDDPVGYIAGAGHDTQILFGALLELLLIIANIGTAVVIFPILRRQSEEGALGYVTARLVECTFILVGILAFCRHRHAAPGAAGAAEGTVAYMLAAIKDWTFLLGPGWVVGWGNGLTPRLPDVPLGPGTATRSVARPPRRNAAHRDRDGHSVHRQRPE